ncbi:unnamed protein product, partial [Ostreobium quekettii]
MIFDWIRGNRPPTDCTRKQTPAPRTKSSHAFSSVDALESRIALSSTVVELPDSPAIADAPGGVTQTPAGSDDPATADSSSATASVVGRHLFYNNSRFDDPATLTGDAGINANDDAAIATDKTALMPGVMGSFENYTGYSRGINGIMVDIARPAGPLTAADFEFKVGNNNAPDTWEAAPPISGFDVREGAGENGSDRVTITWEDNTIRNQWLQVTVLANENTGLSTADVHYWGNQIGETGNDATTTVDGADTGAVVNNASAFSSVDVASPYDLNKSGFVDGADTGIVVNSATGFGSLTLFAAPVPVSLDGQPAPGSSLIGVDLGGQNTPTNWNSFNGTSDTTISNLIDETGYDIGATHTVTITGASTLNFSQNFNANETYINDELGDSTRDLSSYAELMAADGSGQIIVQVVGPPPGGLGVMALALRTAAPATHDFGDAASAAQSGFAASYPVTLAQDGARHLDAGPQLGANRDIESDGFQSVGADSDDNAGVPDDEDGITFASSTILVSTAGPTTGSVDVSLVNADPTSNRLDAWIDWNRDGDWNDAGEQIFTDFDLGTSDGVQSLNFAIPHDTGTNVEEGDTYARFRLSTTGGLGVTGEATDGEVEDYLITIDSFSPFDPPVLSQLNGTYGFRLDGEEASDFSGFVSSSAGDINGDGFDDIIVGARSANPGGTTDAGTTYIVFGKSSGFTTPFDLSSVDGTNGFRLDGVNAEDSTAWTVNGAGDINNDGFDDIIIGSRFGDAAAGFSSAIDLTALNGSTGFRIDEVASGDELGFFHAASTAGDFNADGFDDILLGARKAANSGAGSGSAYILYGAGSFASAIDLSSLNGSNGFRIDAEAAGDELGLTVNNVGDVNADGFDDVVLGARLASPGGSAFAGASYVVFGASSGFGATFGLTGLNGTNGFRIDGATAGDQIGLHVNGAGDVNADGFDDIAVATRIGDPASGADAGIAYVVFGAAGGFSASLSVGSLTSTTGFQIDGENAGDHLGRSIGSVGDVDGDGFDDLLIGADNADPNGANLAGSTYVVFGKLYNSRPDTQVGDSAADTLTATQGAGVDVLIGGLNDDILISDGGADVLRGGGGDDDLSIPDVTFSSTRRVQGGAGTDTLLLNGSGLTLDLTAIPDNRITDIEEIDITGTGANTLTLDVQEVLNISSHSNTLVVRRGVQTDGSLTASLSVTTQGDEDGPVNIVFTVTLNALNDTGSAITFDLDDLLTGTATSGTDYTAIPANAQISVAHGATTGTLSVTVTDDALLEGTETLDAQISNSSDPAVTIGTATATANIADDETATADLSVTTHGDEAGPVNIVFTVTLSEINNTGSAITFDLDDLGSGSATSGTDYTAIPANAQISVADGATTGTLTVVVTDDALLEATETLAAQISNSSEPSVSIGTVSATANITDNDTATADLSVTTQGNEAGPVNIVFTVTLSKVNNTGSAITFDLDDLGSGSATSGTDYTAIPANAQISVADGATTGTLSVTVTDDSLLEGPVNIVYTVTLSRVNNTGSAITFDLDDLGSGSATSGTDYTAIPANAQISVADGATTGTLTVVVSDDALLEGTETVIAQISNASDPAVTIGTSSATANITDDETATADLSVTTQGNEAGPVNIVYTVTLSRVNNTGSAITFDLDDLGSGTAASGSDYTAIPANAQISVADGATTGTLTVTVTDDSLLESTETVVAQISNSSSSSVSIVTLSKVNDTGSAITFDLDDLGTGTATSGDDYTAIPANAQISVANGASTGTLTVNVTDDAETEALETLIAQISNSSNPAVTINTDTATANITDNDATSADLSVTTHGDEFGPTDIEFTVTLSRVNNTGSAITFDLDDLGTGSATSGSDYTAIPANAQISVADGATTGSLIVAVTDDALLESTETLTAEISNPSNPLISINTASATANITDDDTATADLSVTTQGDEAGPVDIVFTVTLSKVNNTGSAITFDLDDLESGTATSGSDYTAFPANAQITVADGSSTGTLTVTVTDDAVLETTETVTAEISNSSDPSVTIGTASATANITDNDTATAELSVTTHGDEDGPVDIVFTVTLDKVNNTGSAITFDLDDLGTGTATSGDDYTAIPANAQITISNSSNPAVTIGTATATANIADDDVTTADLSVTTDGDETGPVNIVFTVTLSKTNNSGSAITFDLDDLGSGSAASGSDYTAIPANAQISVADGASTGSLIVAVTDDALLESTETLVAQISNVSDPLITIDTDTATANITDNDTATADLSVTTHGDEAGPIDIAFTVTLDKVNNTGSAITFDLDDLGTGSAISGSDYTAIPANAQISVADGATTGTLTVTVTDDALLETTETVTAQISNSSDPAVSIGTASATANITDNDTATADLSVTMHGDEDGPVDIEFTVTLSKTNNTGAAINFDLDDLLTGTATSGDDYTAIPANAQITVADGSSTGTFTVAVTDDGDTESLETLIAQISSSSNPAVTINTASATANIADNDASTLIINIDQDTILEGVTITATAAGFPSANETIDVIDNETPGGGSLIGIDFGGGTVPTNWNSFNGVSGDTLSNLTDEAGATTNTDVQIFFAATATTQSFTPAPNELPLHTQSLSGIDGTLVDFSSDNDLFLTFSDLSPEQIYEIYIFGGHNIDTSHSITIPGQILRQNYDANELLINDSKGDSIRELWTTAEFAAADVSGELSIAIRGSYVNGIATLGVSAVAIREAAPALYDFGDAPGTFWYGFESPYPVSEDGARHLDSGPRLGLERDIEVFGEHGRYAETDDENDVDDEDGIVFASPFIVSLTDSVSTGSVDVHLTNADSTSNRLDAWIDWNRDGDWDDPDEQIFTDFDLGTFDGIQALNFVIPQDTGTNVEEGLSYARFRLSTAGGLATTGPASDGEVEDYQITIDTVDPADTQNLALLDGTNGFRLDGDSLMHPQDFTGGFPAELHPSDLNGTNGFRLDGANSVNQLGSSVSSAGDINADGFDDLLIGAKNTEVGNDDHVGSVYVLFGHSGTSAAAVNVSSLDGTNGLRFDGIADSDTTGVAVSGAGDINADGFDDLMIGASGADPVTSGEGSTYIIFGRSGGFASAVSLSTLNGTNGFRIDGFISSGQSGRAVSNAGDVNGDGFHDIIIGAPQASLTTQLFSSGAAWVVFGAAAGFTPTIQLSSLDGTNGFQLSGPERFADAGWSVGTAGDINGDGFSDVVIGAIATSPVDDREGTAFTVFGRSGGFSSVIQLSALDGSTGFRLNGTTTFDSVGESVGGGGDVNADGFDDLIVGATGAFPSAGSTYVIFGRTAAFASVLSVSDISGSVGFRLDGRITREDSGKSVSHAGDVNGDGFDDIAIGADYADPFGNANSGSGYVVFGSNLTGGVETQVGDAAANTLTATQGAGAIDILVGAQGNDTLISDGGADVLRGAQGDDILSIPDTDFSSTRRVQGGNGFDTLVLDGSGLTLDLTVIPDNRIVDIEAVDLTGSGTNTLILTAREVLNLSTHSNTLLVRGTAGDVVNIEVGWTQQADEVIGPDTFRVYTQGAATLKVESTVSVSLLTLNGISGFRLNGTIASLAGHTMSNAGDINGDGFDDLIVGAWGANADSSGANFVVFGQS